MDKIICANCQESAPKRGSVTITVHGYHSTNLCENCYQQIRRAIAEANFRRFQEMAF